MPVTVTHTVSRDDGGYINIGRLGTLGSQMTNVAGKAFSFWIRTVDSGNVIPMHAWFAYPSMGPDYGLFMLNMDWTADYVGSANGVGIYCPTDSACWFYTKATGVNFNDGQYHHHCVSWFGFSGSPRKPTSLEYYIDGVGTTNAWVDRTDGTVSGTANYGGDIWMGCSRKSTGGTATDFASFRLADYRIYDRGLTGAEVSTIYKLKGRDNIRRGLHTQLELQRTELNSGYNGVPAILGLDGTGIVPTFNTDSVLQGLRKKIF